ncbi:MAG: DUF4870 domain-containing protein [Bacteroidota bacterium]
MSNTSDNNNAFLMHLSSFSGYLFPFGAIIVPLIIWELKKKDSEFLDKTGKEVINFNLSYLLYFTVLVIALISFAINIAIGEIHHLNLFFVISLGALIGIICIVKFVLIIVGAIKANQGEDYKYPLIIRFLK